MDEKNCRKRLRDPAICPVCLDYFTDPVTLDCGHNFCFPCIVSPGKSLCPVCSSLVETKKLRPNSDLASMVEVAQGLSNPQKHHHVYSMEEAEKEVAKDPISCHLQVLRKDRENILSYTAENEKESQDLLSLIEAESVNTTDVFRKYHQFLEEQEALLKSKMEKAKRKLSRRKDKNLAKLTGELTSLDRHIQELEEKQQQPAIDLQNLGDIFERYKRKSFQNPVTFPAALRWRINQFQDISPYLDGVIQKVKDVLLSGFWIEEVNVTLDGETAFPGHIVSCDLKSVGWKNENQDVIDRPRDIQDNIKIFNVWPFLLGREDQETGRAFWDVEVEPEGDWAVGVAKASVTSLVNPEISPENGFWDLGKWDGAYRVHDPRHDLPLSVSQELKTVRVTVNYEGGRVAFYDADTGRQLYVYEDTFDHPLQPYFAVSGRGRLTILS